MICYSDNTILTTCTGENLAQNFGLVYHFNATTLLNSYDMCALAGVYPYETRLLVTKNDRVFLITAIIPLTYWSTTKYPDTQFYQAILELSPTAVLNYVSMGACPYGFQMAYDPEYNLLYVVGIADNSAVDGSGNPIDLAFWIYSIDNNAISTSYTLLAGAANNLHFSEDLERMSLSLLPDPQHNFLLSYRAPNNGYNSALINFYNLFKQIPTPYASPHFKNVLNAFQRSFNSNFAINRHELYLGTEDTVTGVPEKLV